MWKSYFLITYKGPDLKSEISLIFDYDFQRYWLNSDDTFGSFIQKWKKIGKMHFSTKVCNKKVLTRHVWELCMKFPFYMRLCIRNKTKSVPSTRWCFYGQKSSKSKNDIFRKFLLIFRYFSLNFIDILMATISLDISKTNTHWYYCEKVLFW